MLDESVTVHQESQGSATLVCNLNLHLITRQPKKSRFSARLAYASGAYWVVVPAAIRLLRLANRSWMCTYSTLGENNYSYAQILSFLMSTGRSAHRKVMFCFRQWFKGRPGA